MATWSRVGVWSRNPALRNRDAGAGRAGAAVWATPGAASAASKRTVRARPEQRRRLESIFPPDGTFLPYSLVRTLALTEESVNAALSLISAQPKSAAKPNRGEFR